MHLRAGWQLKEEILAVQPLAAETSSRDVDCHLSDAVEPELVCKVHWFGLDIVDLTSKHGKGCRTSFLERGWSLFPLCICRW